MTPTPTLTPSPVSQACACRIACRADSGRTARSQGAPGCSVDLRDGNQALIEPMDPERKRHDVRTTRAIGFSEIEVGFPAVLDTDFEFVRRSSKTARSRSRHDPGHFQARPAHRAHVRVPPGADKAIVHLYNSTSTVQRRVVFGLDEAGITDIAVKGAERCRMNEAHMGDTRIRYEYSPESFTGTELPFAKQICESVMDVFVPTPDDPLILNLPATVEMSTANIYGDMIEWFHRNIRDRDSIVLSLHPHNDRHGVAAAEFGVMAGADRARARCSATASTGNVDVVSSPSTCSARSTISTS